MSSAGGASLTNTRKRTMLHRRRSSAVCPVREADWGRDGVQNDQNQAWRSDAYSPPNGMARAWLVTEYDPAARIAFTCKARQVAAQIAISLQEFRGQHQCSHSLHLYRLVTRESRTESYDKKWLAQMKDGSRDQSLLHWESDQHGGRRRNS